MIGAAASTDLIFQGYFAAFRTSLFHPADRLVILASMLCLTRPDEMGPATDINNIFD